MRLTLYHATDSLGCEEILKSKRFKRSKREPAGSYCEGSEPVRAGLHCGEAVGICISCCQASFTYDEIDVNTNKYHYFTRLVNRKVWYSGPRLFLAWFFGFCRCVVWFFSFMAHKVHAPYNTGSDDALEAPEDWVARYEWVQVWVTVRLLEFKLRSKEGVLHNLGDGHIVVDPSYIVGESIREVGSVEAELMRRDENRRFYGRRG